MSMNYRAIRFLLLIFSLLMLCPPSAAKTIYVDDDAIGLNDGTSWANAYMYLQEALADAKLAEKPVEIRVAQGIYRPNGGLVAIPEFDWRTTTFQLLDGVTLKGGYAGLGTPDPNARDVESYETILSGDLNGDDDPNFANNSDNSYHVVSGSDTDVTTVLDGVTITAGNADGQEEHGYDRGGGFFSDSGSPLVKDCKLTQNTCLSYGAGMYLSGQCQAVIRACHIVDNSSADDGGGLFIKNDLNLYDCSPLITDCIIENNRAVDGSGGIRCDDYTKPTIRNCIIAGNVSGDEGGGVSCKWQCSPTIENCTIVGNASNYGGGIYCIETDVRMVNCILWANRANHGNQISVELLDEEEFRTFTRLFVSYCDVQGGRDAVYVDEGCELYWSDNILSDPCFADSGSWNANNTPEDASDDSWIHGNYHLKSEAGRWDPVGEDWVVDDVTSPCIDAGDPNSPVAFEPFPNGGVINMGAYGGTIQASKSPSGLHAKYGGGSGEPNEPYLIYTLEHMNTIGLHAEDRDSHFKLMADIDLSSLGSRDFNIIGTFPNYFRGVFDGNGHTISNFTYISTDVNYVGLFDVVEGNLAEIRDLGLIDPFIDAGLANPILNNEYAFKANRTGSLVNYLDRGTITRCYVRGGSVSGDVSVGGLVANNKGGTIVDCSSTANVAGFQEIGGLVGYNRGTIIGCHVVSTITGEESVGGLVGSNEGTIRNSNAMGEVVGDTDVGGLVGKNRSSEMIQSSFSTGYVIGVSGVGGLVGRSRGDIACCYSTCGVSGGVYVGGLVGFLGRNIIDCCYSTGHVVREPMEGYAGDPRIGGLVGNGFIPGKDDPALLYDVLRSFWNIETSGQTVSFGGTGLTTAEMQMASTFIEAGWDFIDETSNGTEDIWWITEGQDYPRLWWELEREN